MNNPNFSKKNVEVIKKILSKNDEIANELRAIYKTNNLYVINMLSSPGSGKTTFLESLSAFDDFKFGVIEGDLETNRDADRIAKKGIQAYQISTGEACHLEAFMVKEALDKCGFNLGVIEFLFIENVGNLVCPASYDLGAALNITLLSTPEGDDKVLKYPSAFMCADVVVISKADLKDIFEFRVEQVRADLKMIDSKAMVIELNSRDRLSVENLKNIIKEYRDKKYYSTYSF